MAFLMFINIGKVYAVDVDGHFIAHAGGQINGFRYTNSLEALNHSYEMGFRYFELDLVEDIHGNVLAAHDWDWWVDITYCDSIAPVTKEHFMTHKIYDLFTPLDMDDINEWFSIHTDAVLVTDKINNPEKMASLFVDKSRLYMELFSLDAIAKAKQLGVNYMMSENVVYQIKKDKLKYLIDNEIPAIAITRRKIEEKDYKELFTKCKENNIKVWVFHVNFDSGKDEKYVYENEMPYIYGMYADKWIDEFSTKTSLEEVSSSNLKVYYNGNLLNIKSESEIRSLTIYDVTGALVARFNDIYNIEFQTLINSNSGLIILQVETTDAVEVFKVL